MIRFYTLGIWNVVAAEGYSFVMRMDEDSVLWSPIRYNIFQYMATANIEYGYRLAAWESGFPGALSHSFHTIVRSYVIQEGLSPGWLLEECPKDERSIHAYNLAACGEPWGVYNNWFVSKISFWLRPDVQGFLRYVNSTHTIYSRRYNDILWQSAALKLFMGRDRVHMFRDFAYEHATIREVRHRRGSFVTRCVLIGGMAMPVGIRQKNLTAARNRLNTLLSMERCVVTVRPNMNRVVIPCLQTNGRYGGPIEAFMVGPYHPSVTSEQPFCDRSPAPYYCHQQRARNRPTHARAVCSNQVANWTASCASLPREMHGRKGTLDICPASVHLGCSGMSPWGGCATPQQEEDSARIVARLYSRFGR